MTRPRLAPLAGLLASVMLAFAATAGAEGADTDVHSVATTYPTNAAKIFRWGNALWKDEFVKPLSTSMWSINHPSLVRNQHGMLTINATPTSGDVVATVKGRNKQYGRWEARVRARNYKGAGAAYHAVWELVPYSGGYQCGARNLVLSDYGIGTNVATMHVRNAPDADFTVSRSLPLSGNQFHTYAVEVTPDHVSWFVDTHVIMTERRPAALSGAIYTARFRLVATPGATMRTARMQMDWVRYYTLARKNAQPITAPQATQTTYADAC